MPSFDVSFAYLELLGVEPNSASTLGANKLRVIVHAKRVEWTKNATNPLYQQECRANLERISAFEQLLNEPEALEAYLNFQQDAHKERRVLQAKYISELASIAINGSKRSISARQCQLIKNTAVDEDISENAVEEILRELGVSITPGPPPSNGTPTLPYQHPAIDAAIVAQLKSWLKTLRKRSLYEVLDLPQRTSPANLLRVATIMYEQWSRRLPKTTECLAWEKSLQACRTFLKDGEAKSRYDRALFNDVVDRFVTRIDLVLDDGNLTEARQKFLAKLGVATFGLSGVVVDRCIAARAYSLGLQARPLRVEVKPDGYVRCQRCLALALIHENTCEQCGSVLRRRCANPACRQYVSERAAACGNCRLPVIKGREYVELLRLADAALTCGHGRTAIDACQHAKQIIDSPEIARYLEKASDIRSAITSLEKSISERAWSRARDTLHEVAQVAPDFQKNGIPGASELSRHIATIRRVFDSAEESPDPRSKAEIYVQCLSKWTDFRDCYTAAFQVFRSAKANGDNDTAFYLANELILCPLSESTFASFSPELRHFLETRNPSAKCRLRDTFALDENHA